MRAPRSRCKCRKRPMLGPHQAKVASNHLVRPGRGEESIDNEWGVEVDGCTNEGSPGQ